MAIVELFCEDGQRATLDDVAQWLRDNIEPEELEPWADDIATWAVAELWGMNDSEGDAPRPRRPNRRDAR